MYHNVESACVLQLLDKISSLVKKYIYFQTSKKYGTMKKILVANRGEIALRVMRTAKKMGIQTVAVYSEADREAPFVKFADEAYCIGPPPSSESYLKMDKIIDLAQKTNTDGIHPGYGFLSENADFAQKVTDAGITFIGPKPHSIKIMGSKLEAKNAVKDFGTPLVPGTDEAIEDPNKAIEIAKSIGYPVLIKASAGGGGKGMRIVRKAEELESQMERAISEAKASFGDGAVFIEKFVDSPRHIEIQILADNHGNIIHLFERECSIQRRHQKVVEEAPSAKIDDVTRKAMGTAAINAAKACEYVGAGTVEFLADANNDFYFLEMNTRLQVEHPVTEMITGVDLVEQQIRIARGEKLSIAQEDLQIDGHAIELRVYAEDAYENFMPSIGPLNTYQPPSGEGIRVDDGFEEGMNVPIFYDPMISKLSVHAESRMKAIALMAKAISHYQIEGIQTTLEFGHFVMHHDEFIKGTYDTQFVNQHFSAELLDQHLSEDMKVAAMVGLKMLQEEWDRVKTVGQEDEKS